ncbi:unnamed protein product [Lymnaea stagnalis]|uniref:C-type lectin domain-containing protein n=1 Tax=Lymnaea stagnalis TaxID=6523 RepID=A0AAV2IJ77_LYMST
MYNKITKLCTPGSGLSTSQLPPSSNEGDLYVTDSCDSYPEFSQYSYNTSTTFAATFNVPVNYTQAAVTCKCLDSHLFVAKTVEKYALFSKMTSGCTWMGLDDIEVEGQFVWSDDHQQIDQLTMQTLSFQPDNAAGRQNCARGCNAWLDDDYCHLQYRFICEKSNSPC